MARKDVDLVIRAKDEAAKVIDQITAALNEFTNAQNDVDARSGKTKTALGQLGAAFATLDKQISGLEVGNKLTDDLVRAEKALQRVEEEFKNSASRVADLEKSYRQAGDSADRLAQKTAGAERALSRQTGAVKQAKQDQRELAVAYSKAATEQGKLVRRQTQLPELIDRASIAARKAAQRFSDLSAQVAGTAKPSRTLRDQLDSSARSAAKTASRLQALREEYGAIGGKIRAAGSAMAIFGTKSEEAKRNLARQEAILRKIAGNYKDLQVRSRSASANQARLASELKKATAAFARQKGIVEKARQDYTELAAATGRAQNALKRLGGQSLGALGKELQNQRRSALEAKRSYRTLTDEATRLAGEIARVGVPTREMAENFARTKVAAAGAKQEYIEQRRALELMGRVLREAGTDLDSIKAAQERFKAIQSDLASQIERTTRATEREQQSLNQIYGATTRASQGLQATSRGHTRAASATERHAQRVDRLRQAYRQFYGDTRRSLSLLQRIRGEVLSLVAAYAGLYAGIEVIRGTIQATQTLEAAQARLNVAFEGDKTRVAQELDFIRRTANRLGIDMGVLATEYSKFNIAAKNTALEGAATRKLFLQVAEAARVNRSSTDEMKGVFVALTQIISKGAVQMEELRQQLGDRLPGALQIMADGLGVTTAELVKMMEQGQITEAALIPFGDELERRFGPQLADSLGSLSVAIGRLGNAAFQALVKFGQSGFIDDFKDFVDTLTETMQSADFEAFMGRASAALGSLVSLLGFFAENFQIVVATVTGFIGLRLAPVLIAISGSLQDAATAGVRAARGFAVTSAAATTAGRTMVVTASAVRGLTVAFRTLLSATGVGLAITAISAGIGLWATSADSATEALNEHRKILDRVKDAYDAVSGSVEDWRAAVADLTATEAVNNLRRLREAAKDLQDQLEGIADQSFVSNFFGYNIGTGAEFFDVSRNVKKAVNGVIRSYREGNLSAEEFLDRLDRTFRQMDDGTKEFQQYSDAVLQAARDQIEASKAVEEAEKIVAAKTGTDEEATKALKELAGAQEEVNSAFDPEKSSAYASAMEALDKIVRDTTADVGYLAEVMQIDGAFKDAIDNAQTLEERISAAITRAEALQGVTQKFVDSKFGSFTNGDEAAAALIRSFEGFRATPYYDVNAYRVGFGSDTITLSDGTIQDVVQGMRVSVADANRDLIRRITQEFRPIAERAAGADRFGTFTPQQQAALVSIAYNYGRIPDRIAEVVRTGTNEQIAAAIRSLAGDNGGINRNRRLQEAALFTSTAGIDGQIQEQLRLDQERTREQERQAELAQQQREATQRTIADNQFELDQQQLINQGKEREAAIQEAIRAAKAENPNITKEELDLIAQQAAKMFDLEQAQKNIVTDKERAQQAEEEVNRLLGIQQQLREQMKIAQESGDAEKAQELKDKIAEVNDELLRAIDNAIAMWSAIGGTEADLAIAKLQTAKVSASSLGTEANNVYLKWDRVADLFVNGLASAFDQFSRSVAEGENVWDAARKAFLKFAADFLIQIAQMIIKQAIFNALQGAFGGTGFGTLIGLGHTGGMVGESRVGSGNNARLVNPMIFASALRYHQGGIPGLKPGEVPIIAKKGEEILTREDPRNALNGGLTPTRARAEPARVKIVNAIDGASLLEQALNSEMGEQVLLNFMRANADAIAATGS